MLVAFVVGSSGSSKTIADTCKSGLIAIPELAELTNDQTLTKIETAETKLLNLKVDVRSARIFIDFVGEINDPLSRAEKLMILIGALISLLGTLVLGTMIMLKKKKTNDVATETVEEASA